MRCRERLLIDQQFLHTRRLHDLDTGTRHASSSHLPTDRRLIADYRPTPDRLPTDSRLLTDSRLDSRLPTPDYRL
jgi:hypothetical protein